MRALQCLMTAFADRLPRFGGLVLIVWIGAAGPSAAVAASLSPSLLPKIEAATFEVVAAKPVHDPLTYASPLPLDLLPYQQRTDKYHSIGTAFALGNDRYVTAAHVFRMGLDSLWGPLALRDAKGRVYAIDKVEKFAYRRDFVVFSLVKPPVPDVALQVNTKPVLNQNVYAVGNALGTGVVIRNGLYTSNTPEQQDGKWNWLRFSAAASPGNSGGPLLDQDGRVIGVVLMKSPVENLNYALPISEVLDAPANRAVIDQRVPYAFDLFDTTITGTFKAEFALPLSPADFYATYLKLKEAYEDSQLKALLAKEPDRVFPRGTGSNRVLFGTARLDSFPAFLTRNSAGDWAPMVQKGPRIALPDNGYVAGGYVPGSYGGINLLFHLREPDTATGSAFYQNPGQTMDMLLKLGFMSREIARQKIRVTSLGNPALNTTFTENWQRHWQVWMWPVPFANTRFMVLALPVPDGYAGFMRMLPARRQHDFLINLEAMTDFFEVAYTGSLAQWKAYLANTALLPDVFKTIRIDADYGRRFAYTSQRLDFGITPQLQKIQPDSELTLGFSYFPDHGKVVWDVAEVRLKVDPDDSDGLDITRHVAPPSDLDDTFRDAWRRIEQRQHPYDGVAFNDNDVTRISGVMPAAGPNPSVLYTASCAVEGTHPQNDMKARLDLLMDNLHVRE